MQWTIHSYGRFLRTVSDRAARLPIEGAGLRQAVVRIRSRQSLTRFRDGQVMAGSGQEREVKEYVVIQRRLWKGREEAWLVWGTMEESAVEKVEVGAGGR